MAPFIPRLHSRDGNKTSGNNRTDRDRFDNDPDPYRARSQERYQEHPSNRRRYEEDDYDDRSPYQSSYQDPRFDDREDDGHRQGFWNDDQEYREPKRSRRRGGGDGDWNEKQSPMTFALAVAIIVVLSAFGWFAYQWISPSELAAPPIIRADNPAFKIRPDNPGGMVIPHQDKLVYGRFAPNEQQTVEHLLAPPEQPVAPEERYQQQQYQQQPPYPQGQQGPGQYGQPQQQQMQQQPMPPQMQPQMMPQQQVSQQPAQSTSPQSQPTKAAPTHEDVLEDLDDIIAKETSKKGGKKGSQPFVSPASSTSTNEPTSVPIADSGRYMVQIAAAESYGAAEKQWKKLSSAAPELCHKKGVMIKEAGQGKTAYRVFIGPFQSTNTAEKFVKGAKGHGFKPSILSTQNG